MHQTKILTMNLSGLILDIDPKEIIKPRGKANKSVNEKIRHVI